MLGDTCAATSSTGAESPGAGSGGAASTGEGLLGVGGPGTVPGAAAPGGEPACDHRRGVADPADEAEERPEGVRREGADHVQAGDRGLERRGEPRSALLDEVDPRCERGSEELEAAEI